MLKESDSLLPENRRRHAQDISFTLQESGCSPQGCCNNTGCDMIEVVDPKGLGSRTLGLGSTSGSAASIPAQVDRCSRNLPTGCYFYARASANITGSLCQPYRPHQSIWSYPNGVSFDMINLNGWAIPSFTLWRFHNIAASDCDKITLGTSSNVSNLEKRAIRSCEWTSDEESEMLIESNRAPMSAFSSSTIRIGNSTRNDIDDLYKSRRRRGGGDGGGGVEEEEQQMEADIITIRLKSLNQPDCKFTLDNYFKFPLLEVPLQLLVTSSSVIADYVSKAVDTTMRESVGDDLEVLVPKASGGSGSGGGGGGGFEASGGGGGGVVTPSPGGDRIGSLIGRYGKTEVVKLYLKYLTSSTKGSGDQSPIEEAVARRQRRRRLLHPMSSLFTTPYWPPVNWAWSGGGDGVGVSVGDTTTNSFLWSSSAASSASASLEERSLFMNQTIGLDQWSSSIGGDFRGVQEGGGSAHRGGGGGAGMPSGYKGFNILFNIFIIFKLAMCAHF